MSLKLYLYCTIFISPLPLFCAKCTNTTLSATSGLIYFETNQSNAGNYECKIVQIFVPDGKMINIKISDYSAPQHYVLSLTVYDGSSDDDWMILYIYDVRDSSLGRSSNGSQNSMLLIFEKLASSVNSSKEALIGVQFNTFASQQCICPTKPFTGSGGDDLVIYSPLYDLRKNYCNNLNCTYMIILDKAYRVKLAIEQFITQQEHDILIAYDGGLQGEVLFNLSGNGIAYFTVKSTTNRMTLQFLTDSSITHPGFKLQYELFQDVCGCPTEKYREESGQLRSPGFPYPWRQCDKEDKRKNCTYLISVGESQTVFLNFSIFDLNNDSYLEILDGNSHSGVGKVLANLTFFDGYDALNGSNYTSSSNTMFLHFVLVINDDLAQHFHRGFEANYWVADNSNPQNGFQIQIVIPAVVAVITLLLIPLALYRFHKRVKRKRRQRMIGLMTTMHRRKTTINQYSNEEFEIEDTNNWEISLDDLEIDSYKPLGSGAFGSVYKGRLKGGHRLRNKQVAVKTMGEYSNIHSLEAFLQEIECMKSVGYCQYLVNLVGCCTKTNSYCLVMEYCEGGDLLSYVKRVKNEQNINNLINEFNSFAWQIAAGMEYLSSRKIIHRDLAARNVLLDGDKRSKIGDFGLSRCVSHDVYVTKGGRLPIKWMAIESIKEHLFTTKSDVWSYAVLLYEMYSFGKQPFEFIEPRDLLELLLEGERLQKTEHCPQKIYNLMQWCWSEKAEDRPAFEKIKLKVEKILQYASENQVMYLEVGSL